MLTKSFLIGLTSLLIMQGRAFAGTTREIHCDYTNSSIASPMIFEIDYLKANSMQFSDGRGLVYSGKYLGHAEISYDPQTFSKLRMALYQYTGSQTTLSADESHYKVVAEQNNIPINNDLNASIYSKEMDLGIHCVMRSVSRN